MSSSTEAESDSSDSSDGNINVAAEKRKLRKKRRNRNVAVLFGFYLHARKYLNKRKRREHRCTGQQWTYDTLGSTEDCYEMYRMTRPCFDALHDRLAEHYGSKGTKFMCSEEALAMFLWTVGGPQSVSQVHNRFHRSTDTIHRKFNHVLACLNRMAGDIIRPFDRKFRTMHDRLRDSRFYPHFNNCIGAIDGTHIPVVVPADEMINHVGRHGYATQNVMAVCDFDMRFTSIVAGWPGSAHDTRIFRDTLDKYKKRFPHPPAGKYYLVDSGYPNDTGYLAPYRGQKYHLPEFRMGRPPSVKKQTKIIIACMALHNFIRESEIFDEDFDKCDRDEDYMPPGHVVVTNGWNHEGQGNVNMNATREAIADGLMADRE
ncbi:protein ALP1-like [Brachypodium distachyon]|uniref:protein ALP1-like n=1 Tax=Brachypodium distachyon TaxID=15368 RepID=UPI000D0D60EA|nr:protein ALP1-like [Brachypodium distachyon]|eukprot:XP_024312968.1 protein ALP1-like [Brachypodium distachyon]